jgi:hypothetical protein
VVRTFEAGKFYAVGFPFDATPSVAPSELLTYDGAQLQPATAIKKDTGYLIKFAAAGEVTFTSTDNPVLPSATSMIPTASATASYRFIANPCVSNVLYVLSMTSGAYYRYNSEGHYFQKVATPVTNTNPVKPFEGIIISTNRTAEYISLGSTSKLPREVTYTKSVGVSITSGQQAATMVPYDSAFVLTFTVDSGYTAPEVTVGSSAYTLGAPDAAGAYSVRIDAVTQDTAIGITVTRKRYSVQVNTNGVAQVTEPVASPPYMVWHDSTFTLKFTLNAGYENLQVSVGSAAPYAPGSDTSGAYTVAIGSVKGDSTINIAASLKRFSVGVASGSSVVVGSSLPQDVAYGDTLTFTFTLSAHYVNPQVTLNGAGYALAPPADGVYTVTVPSVTSSVSISVSATLESLDVTVTADHVTVTSHSQANASSYTVLYGSEDTLTFTVDEFYVNPQVTVNGESYTLAAPVNDVYTVITLITENTAVSITASLEEFDLMLTVGENITLVAPAAAGSVPAAYGSELVVSFRVAAGYAPVVKTDGISVEVGAPSADGLYTVTAVEQVTGEHYIALTATRVETPNAVYKEDPSDPVVHVQYYTVVGQEVRKPVRTELLIVKRTHASKKVVVRKEMVVVN